MSTNDQDRYDVSGRYASAKASPAPTKLPAPTSRPNGAQEPRRAVVLSIPTPALDRGRMGRRELRGFVDRLGQGCEVAGAIARFNVAQENLEKSTQTLEQTFATGAAGLRALQNRLAYEGESLSLEYAHHLAELRQGVVDENRRNELADTQFEIEKARKAAELAEAREAARSAAVLAERKAAALAADASADQLRKEIELENARRTMNEMRGRRIETEFDGDAGDGDDPPAFREAHGPAKRSASRSFAPVTVGSRPSSTRSAATSRSSPTSRSKRWKRSRKRRSAPNAPLILEQATGAIFPDRDEEESQ